MVNPSLELRNCPRSIFARRLPQRKPTSQTMSYTRQGVRRGYDIDRENGAVGHMASVSHQTDHLIIDPLGIGRSWAIDVVSTRSVAFTASSTSKPSNSFTEMGETYAARRPGAETPAARSKKAARRTKRSSRSFR